MIAQLGKRGDGQAIIILDEIDQLLDWDQHHATDSVPEAFFRACRSVSQEGAAHFVFSGERRIAKCLWDPQSPHWNFCREVQLTQLDEADATSLLVDPLRAMNIKIVEPAAFESEAWARTSGHPQIVQFLGDRLVRSLDARSDRRNLTLGADDIVTITETFEFAEHYLSTYWGQATPFERSVSRAIAAGCTTSADVLTKLEQGGDEALFNTLRMLQLYGIIEERDGQLRMRAAWFAEALAHFNDYKSIFSKRRNMNLHGPVPLDDPVPARRIRTNIPARHTARRCLYLQARAGAGCSARQSFAQLSAAIACADRRRARNPFPRADGHPA